MEGERGEVFCHGNGGGLTSRQHDQGSPNLRRGGLPTPVLPPIGLCLLEVSAWESEVWETGSH